MWSDIICPWCYLGERRLRRALRRLPWGDQVDVHLRAFQLDPRADHEPGDLRLALERKYGPGAFDAMTRRLVPMGRAEGIDYRFDLAQRVNTFDGHRLLAWADTLGEGAQQRLGDGLFRAYFTEGRNVADADALVATAASAGLDPAEATTVLAGDAFAASVREDLEDALDLGVTGVPAFAIEGRWLVTGAQDVETMVTLLERARTRLDPAPTLGSAPRPAVE